MFKQVLILAGSIIAIAAVVATTAGDPAEKPAKPAEQVEEKAPPPPKPVTTDESYYDDDENFVFGEPLTYDDGSNSGSTEDRSEYRSASKQANTGGSNNTAPVGSKENPKNVMPSGAKRQN